MERSRLLIPTPLTAPFRLALNRQLRPLFEDGSLSGLDGAAIYLSCRELPVTLGVGIHGGRFVQPRGDEGRAAGIRASLAAYRALMLGTADPDTLFFRRQLLITGDTATALTIKNLLDSQDPAALMPPVLRHLLTVWEGLHARRRDRAGESISPGGDPGAARSGVRAGGA